MQLCGYLGNLTRNLKLKTKKLQSKKLKGYELVMVAVTVAVISEQGTAIDFMFERRSTVLVFS